MPHCDTAPRPFDPTLPLPDPVRETLPGGIIGPLAEPEPECNERSPSIDRLIESHDSLVYELNRLISCIAYYGNDPSLNRQLITQHLDDLTRVLANAKGVR